MNWLSNLFRKNSTPEITPEEKAISDSKWEGYNYFKKGKDCLLNNETNKAKPYFDIALEYGFENNFAEEASELYDLRACCLQKLELHHDAIKDFDKSISLDENDCNKFFSRSISRAAILDYEGEINDLNTAIQLSKIDNALNREYNSEAEKQGFKSGVSELYELRLINARMNQDFHKRKDTI